MYVDAFMESDRVRKVINILILIDSMFARGFTIVDFNKILHLLTFTSCRMLIDVYRYHVNSVTSEHYW